ncbi:protein ANTAGONIST OF LIKE HETEROCHROMATIN PROTEIN 1-like [Henckelia pumila]|uniref:protein ANTAGONIST OF LIKE HETEROCHROMATIN PROTEIN 1-like n=1 Tax=Henckelia pumila TaxID=405737 RepID=UPI003C6DE5A9
MVISSSGDGSLFISMIDDFKGVGSSIKALFGRPYKVEFVAQRRRKYRRRERSYNVTGRIPAQINHLQRIIEIGDVQCVLNLRMNRNAFARLCYLLENVSGIVDLRYVRIQENVAMFLYILAHHKKNRVVGHDYLQSGKTVSSHVHEILRSILKLHPILLGCLGALDGTYISVQVTNKDKAKYRSRKGTTTINVLGVCNRDMQFIYALTGWEGSVADARILRDDVNRQDGLKISRGCYYLCDNGYPNVEGFLTPYRRTRYHMDQWIGGSLEPQNYKEFFNSKHSHARNVIERAFGLLKRRWSILRSPSFYPLKV